MCSVIGVVDVRTAEAWIGIGTYTSDHELNSQIFYESGKEFAYNQSGAAREKGGMPSHVDTTGNSRTPVWAERSDPSVDGFRPKKGAMSDPLCGRKWAVDCEVLSSMRTPDLAGWLG